jgi:hypothetical protein
VTTFYCDYMFKLMPLLVIAGAASSCVIRFNDDGVYAVRRLPRGLQVGSIYDANYNGTKYSCTIKMIGGKRT